MAATHRIRNTLMAGLAVLLVLVLAILLVRGCAEKRREAVRDRASSVARAQGGAGQSQGADASGGSSGSAASPASSGEEGNQLAPPQAPPEEGDSGIIPVEQSESFLEIVEQRVTPYTTTPGHDIACFAQVRGDAASVTMSIADTSGAGGAFTVSLSPGPVGDVVNWSFQSFAPSTPGEYSYTTTAVGQDGRTVTSGSAVFIVEPAE
ncbi:MAG: hypothetical protein AB1760_12040 [Pseudomonadota bacterium]